MDYLQLISRLRPFSKIIVSCPQHSGTTIATEIIAYGPIQDIYKTSS